MSKQAQARRTPLNPERIYRAALTLIDDVGVEELSMRKLASALGVDAMSIYHHVENKQALMLGAFQTVLEELPLPDPMPADWKEALRQLGKGFHELARRYPGIFPAMISSPYGTPREQEIFGYIQAALKKAGLRDGDRPRATAALYTYGIGMANVAVGGLRLRPLYGEPLPTADHSSPGTSDADVEFSIDLMLAGIEVLRAKGLQDQ